MTPHETFTGVMKSSRMKWAGHVAHMKDRRDVYKVLVWKPEGKGRLGRSRRREKSNIEMNFLEVELGHELD